MSVKRSLNLISQQRIDVPDMRAIESASRNDFDELLSSFVTGPNAGYILRGFELSMAGAIGGAASGLQLIVSPGAVFHGASAQSGTFYLVPTGTPAQQLNSATNVIIDGAFAPSAINYVALEYERYIDDTTSAQVYLWNPTTNNETTKNAPRAQILRYRIRISTATPASNFLPIAAVTTDSGNNVIRIDDARGRLFSQGKGGFNPDPFNKFTFSQGRDSGPTFSTSNSVNPFQGGDKVIGNLKEWMDAVTTSIQEIKGTTYWTSLSSSGSLESIRTDLGNTIITGRGNISHDAAKTTPGLMNWSEDIFIRVIGSRLGYKLVANPTSTNVTLADNQVAYITLTRGITIAPNLVFTNNSAIISSVGAVSWTAPLQAGDWIKLGSTTDAFYYQISTVDSLTQVTLTENYQGSSTGASGAKAKYAFGSYQTSITPASARDIFIANRKDVPAGENVFWLMARNDSGGSVARVYVRFLGMEIEDGETEQVSDTSPLQLLEYIGSPTESASKPLYSSAVNPGATTLIEDITLGSAAQIAQNDYWLANASANSRLYYIWYNKDAAGTNPEAPSRIGIEVAITTGMTNIQVAQATAQAFSTTFYPDFTAVQRSSPNDMVVRLTRNSAGSAVASSDFNMGAPFAVTQIQAGSGSGNYVINDGDNLTKAIKKLDSGIGSLLAALDSPNYDEPVDIVAAGQVPPTSLNGPVLINTLITLPNNTRLSNTPQKYTVGKGTLQVFLNGQYQRLGIDWAEVGVLGAASNKIQILRQLEVGDSLEFRLSAAGGGAGGGGGQGPQGPVGPTGPAGQDALGGPISINTYIANYTVLLSNKVMKGNCATNSADITFTLPPAATATGIVFYFKKIDATAFIVYVKGNGSELIDGINIQPISAQWSSFMVVSDGSTWSIF